MHIHVHIIFSLHNVTHTRLTLVYFLLFFYMSMHKITKDHCKTKLRITVKYKEEKLWSSKLDIFLPLLFNVWMVFCFRLALWLKMYKICENSFPYSTRRLSHLKLSSVNLHYKGLDSRNGFFTQNLHKISWVNIPFVLTV